MLSHLLIKTKETILTTAATQFQISTTTVQQKMVTTNLLTLSVHINSKEKHPVC